MSTAVDISALRVNILGHNTRVCYKIGNFLKIIGSFALKGVKWPDTPFKHQGNYVLRCEHIIWQHGCFNTYNAGIFWYKPKCFFENILNVLVTSFCFIGIPMLWVYGHYYKHYNFSNSFSVWTDFRRQNLASIEMNVKFWRLKAVPVLKGLALQWQCWWSSGSSYPGIVTWLREYKVAWFA